MQDTREQVVVTFYWIYINFLFFKNLNNNLPNYNNKKLHFSVCKISVILKKENYATNSVSTIFPKYKILILNCYLWIKPYSKLEIPTYHKMWNNMLQVYYDTFVFKSGMEIIQ